MRIFCHLFTILLALFACDSYARTGTEALDLLLYPNNGCPVVTIPATDFSCESISKGDISLVLDGDRTPLQVSWHVLPNGTFHGDCTIPADIVPGMYNLELSADDAHDTSARSVFVLDTLPEEYIVAFITDVDVAGDGLKEMAALINKTDVALVLVAGNLAENGLEEQYRSLSLALDSFSVPTAICPGPKDDNATSKKYFGTYPRILKFGLDSYLALDATSFGLVDCDGRKAGSLHRLRREMVASRWSIAFGHGYEPGQDIRNQISLLIDDPLDIFLHGNLHRAENSGVEQWGAPWGNTPVIVTPPANEGYVRMIDVNRFEIIPRDADCIISSP